METIRESKILKEPQQIDDRILDGDNFLIDAKKELNRIKRYGHRATFLLIKPHIKKADNNDNYEKLLYHLIKSELRFCDNVYLISPFKYGVILPDTHEGGGESAALRLKRKISQILDKKSKENISSDIGVVCITPERRVSIEDLIDELEKDLNRDKYCQLTATEGEEVKNSLLLYGFSPEISKRVSDRFGYIYHIHNNISKEVTDSRSVEIAFFKADNVSDDVLSSIKKIQKNNKLFYKIDVVYNGDNGENITLFNVFAKRALDSPQTVLDIIGLLSSDNRKLSVDEKKRYKDVFSNIGSFTHQMNQPLQIIMGKVELLLLDLDIKGGNNLTDSFKETLRQIREQIHYAAEINQKINRLTKID